MYKKKFLYFRDGVLCDSFGNKLAEALYPGIHLAEELILCCTIWDANKTGIDLSDAPTLECSMDKDYDHTNSLMVYSTDVNIEGDWADADLSAGKISIRVHGKSPRFAENLGSVSSLAMYAEIKQLFPGTESVIASWTMNALNTVHSGEDEPEPSSVDYYTAAQVDAILAAGNEIEFSVDGATDWHETQSLANDKYFRYRNAEIAGNWSDAIGLIQGQTGAPAPNVKWQYSSDNTSFHDTYTLGDFYFRHSVDNGVTWSAGIYFKGDDGDPGDPAPNVQLQYSVDNTSFHATYTSADIYLRVSVDEGETWSAGMRIKGEKGDQGDPGQFENGVPDYEFTTSDEEYDSETGVFTLPFATLGITEKVSTEIFDSSDYAINEDPRLIKYWSTGALVLDVSRISGFTSGTIRFAGGKAGSGAEMTNPMTAAGDLIVGGVDGVPTRLPIGTAGQVLKVDAAGTGHEYGTISGGGNMFASYMHVQEQQTAGTAGGSATTGSWITRVLNTVVTNTITGASLSSNAITLPAGTYYFSASAPGYKVDGHQIRLYNTTASAVAIVGFSERISAGADNGTRCFLHGLVTIASESVFVLEGRYEANGGNTNSLGHPKGWITEIYADMQIWKI